MADKKTENGSFFTSNTMIIALMVLLMVIGSSGFIYFHHVKNQLRSMFKLNGQLQEQNYYMADFGRKLLGINYHVGKGHYIKSISMLNQYHDQLKSKKGLIKIPDFTSKEEELDFYLNLQNPRTGAFMDDAYPLCTYHGGTVDVLKHIARLAEETGNPVKLKYKLNYLDQINSPVKVAVYLDDVSVIEPIAAKFPQTPFLFARDILSLVPDEKNNNADEVSMPIHKHNLYSFSPQWKMAVLRWFYRHQDPETGLWGPKSKNGKLLKKDVTSTFSILKAFVDKKGNSIHEAYPLRYRKELFASALQALEEPLPASNDGLDDLHEWNLNTSNAMRMLTRYLWKDASLEERNKARAAIRKYISLKCEKYYIPEEGAFAYYPNSNKAALDGSLSFFTFKEIGALSAKKQKYLWGAPEKNIYGCRELNPMELTLDTLESIAISHDVNSFRFYQTAPSYNDLTSEVFAVVYPHQTLVPDIMDLSRKMIRWINTTNQAQGSWISRANIHDRLKSIDFPEVAAFEGILPFDRSEEILEKNNELIVIGFDVMQIPCYKIVFKSNQKSITADESLFSNFHIQNQVSWM